MSEGIGTSYVDTERLRTAIEPLYVAAERFYGAGQAAVRGQVGPCHGHFSAT